MIILIFKLNILVCFLYLYYNSRSEFGVQNFLECASDVFFCYKIFVKHAIGIILLWYYYWSNTQILPNNIHNKKLHNKKKLCRLLYYNHLLHQFNKKYDS